MNRSPLINALGATAYITLIASVLYYGPGKSFVIDGVIAPIILLSLFVLSAAMMGYFFLYQPAQLFFENKPKEAARFFITTVLIFACVTAAIILSWLFLSASLQ
jgi:hypothetical protein